MKELFVLTMGFPCGSGEVEKTGGLEKRGQRVGDRVGWMGKMEREGIKEPGDSGSSGKGSRGQGGAGRILEIGSKWW